MGRFLIWSEWFALSENNARQQSEHYFPNYNSESSECKLKTESKKNPDYSFDHWLKKAQNLGDDIKNSIDHGKSEEEELEKKKKESGKDQKDEKQNKHERPDRSENEEESKETKSLDNDRQENSWNQFKQKTKDTKSKETSTKKSDKHTKSSGEH